MNVQIEVSDETAKILQSNATIRNIDMDAYLRALVEAEARLANSDSLALAEFDRDMDALALPTESLPTLPLDFSRGDLYEDHD